MTYESFVNKYGEPPPILDNERLKEYEAETRFGSERAENWTYDVIEFNHRHRRHPEKAMTQERKETMNNANPRPRNKIRLVLDQFRVGDGMRVHLSYKVAKAIGTTDPYVGKELTKAEVDYLISRGVDVEIVEAKKRR